MFKIVIYGLFFLVFASCDNNRRCNPVADSYEGKYSSIQLTEKFRNFYQINSADSLQNLLKEWNGSVPPLNDNFVAQNDTIINLNSVFSDLYKPFKFGEFNSINYFEVESKYIVVQTEINFDVVSKDEYKRLVYSSSEGYPNDTAYEFYRPAEKVRNFRPQLNLGNAKVLYATPEYKQAIIDFFNLGDFKGDIYKNDTILKRYKFLCPTLPIIYGHWGGYWYIETFPIIERILFEEGFVHASVDFRFGIEETMLQYRLTKKRGHWIADNKWLKIRLE